MAPETVRSFDTVDDASEVNPPTKVEAPVTARVEEAFNAPATWSVEEIVEDD